MYIYIYSKSLVYYTRREISVNFRELYLNDAASRIWGVISIFLVPSARIITR